MKNFKDFHKKEKSIKKDFKLNKIQTIVSSDIAQKYLNEYKSELSVFNKMKLAKVDKTDRDINLYFVGEEFIGFLVTMENYFYFNENKDVLGVLDYKEESAYKSIIIAYVEVRKSIRENTDNPRYGNELLTTFIEENGKKYDAITTQADNDFLLETYYPKYGFEKLDTDLGYKSMVRWS